MAFSNPFRARQSEQASADALFLGLFAPDRLDLLPTDGLWDRLVVLRSAPGGGKTSILRLLTPGALWALHRHRNMPSMEGLAERMVTWGALGPSGPTALGIFLTCNPQYASIREIDADERTRERFFLALLDARIVLAGLQGALDLAGRSYPDDLASVTLQPSRPGSGPVRGDELYRRACQTETAISGLMDDMDADDVSLPDGAGRLPSLDLFAGRVLVDGNVVASRTVLMLDDAHRLHRSQRKVVREMLMERDIKMGRWMAERLEGIEIEEVFAPGAREGRDYLRIGLDGWASDAAKQSSAFEKTVLDIASRRARVSTVIQEHALPDDTFGSFLGELRLEPDRVAAIHAEERSAAEELAKTSGRYGAWVEDRARQDEVSLEGAFEWRALRILIERDRQKSQSELFPDEVLEPQVAEQRGSPGTYAAAELFVCRHHRIPYYHSASRMARLASWNIEQFLGLGADIFDQVIAAVTLKKEPEISAAKQDQLVRRAARRYLDAIPRGLPHGEDISRLVRAVGQMSSAETYKPRASYAPGVTGFALFMEDIDRLRTAAITRQDPASRRLLQALTVAVWNNIFEAQFDKASKGRKVAVFSLNRLLCAHYSLPLQYSGFREKRLDDVKNWIVLSEDGLAQLALSPEVSP
jgi:hypothetical protein